MAEQRKLAAIMFTDIMGYTALMSKDEQKAMQALQKNRDIQKPLIEKYNGEWLKEMGDGTLSCFGSVVDAVNCALEIQRSIKAEADYILRIGIHLGDVVFSGGDVFGDGVNIASRIEPLAPPGGICITEKVYSDLRNKPGMRAVSLGEKHLKNVDHPVKLYALSGEKPPPALSKSSVDGRTEPALGKKLSSRILIGSAFAIVAILGLYTVYSCYFTSPTSAPVTEKITSIAVLPFVNMSTDKDQEYFCDGLAEELLNILAKVKELRVPARTSSFSFKGQNVDVATIGEKLNVESVLEGSVRKSGNKIRITAQLIKVSDGYHLWSETYDRELDDIFAVQTEISQQLVDVLKITLLREEESELTSQPTENVQAYDLYLLGRHNLEEWNMESVEKAIGFFSLAIELDSEYALAWAGLADAHIKQWRAGNVPRNKAMALAEEAAARALALDSLLAEAHTAVGWVKDWQRDFPAAETALKKAIKLNPNYMLTYARYAHLMNVMGRYKDGTAILEQGLEIDPLSSTLKNDVSFNLCMMGRIEESIGLGVHGLWSEFDRLDRTLKWTLELVKTDPANANRHWMLSDAYLALGEYGLAEKSITRARELAPESTYESNVDYNLYLAQGRYAQCLQYAYDRRSKDSDNMACVSMAAFAEMLVGNYQKAITLYERTRLVDTTVGIPSGLTPWFIAAYGRTDLVYLANAYFKIGDLNKGKKLLAESRAFLEKMREQGLGTPRSYYFEAVLNALAGNKQQSMASLRKAIDLGWRRGWYAKLDPPMESLRDDPEFKAMMAEVDADIERQKMNLKKEGLL